MIHPTWLADTLAGLMVGTSLYCVARLVAARVWHRTLHRDTNLAHAADGVAMSGMLVGALRTLPTGAWEIIFGAFSLWFAARGARFVVRRGIGTAGSDHAHHLSHYLSHLVMALSMLYMFLEGTPSASGSVAGAMAMGGGGSRSNLTEVTLLLAVLLFWSAVWHADGLTRYTTARRVLVGAGAPVGDGAAAGGGTASPTTAATDAGTEDGQSRSLAPRLEMACHIALCITMGYMLILLL